MCDWQTYWRHKRTDFILIRQGAQRLTDNGLESAHEPRRGRRTGWPTVLNVTFHFYYVFKLFVLNPNRSEGLNPQNFNSKFHICIIFKETPSWVINYKKIRPKYSIVSINKFVIWIGIILRFYLNFYKCNTLLKPLGQSVLKSLAQAVKCLILYRLQSLCPATWSYARTGREKLRACWIIDYTTVVYPAHPFYNNLWSRKRCV